VGRRRLNGYSRTYALRFGACDATLFSAVALFLNNFARRHLSAVRGVVIQRRAY